MNLIWLATPGTAEAAARELTAAGAELRVPMAYAPPATVAGFVGAAGLGRAIAALYAAGGLSGLAVDLTREPVEVREMPGWAAGTVLVVGAGGPTVHAFESESALGALLAVAA